MQELYLGSPPQFIREQMKKEYEEQYFLKIPLCFEALEDGNIKLVKSGTIKEVSLIYSLDNENWEEWDYSNGTDLNTGQKLYIKSKNESQSFSTATTNNYHFSSTNKFNVYGNIMSLLYNDFVDKKELKESGCLAYTFLYCSQLEDATNLTLPATILTDWCYSAMFGDCSNMRFAPKKLPALTLPELCYAAMFSRCSSLQTSPQLMATDVGWLSYNYMFDGCTSLMQNQYLPFRTFLKESFQDMYSGCSGIKEIHYLKIMETNETFTMSTFGAPRFGATNATVYYDL